MMNSELKTEFLNRLNYSDQPFTATFTLDFETGKRPFVLDFYSLPGVTEIDWYFKLNIDGKVWVLDNYDERQIKMCRQINGRLKCVNIPLNLLSDITQTFP